MVPSDDPPRDQADALCEELNRQIAVLDAKAVRLKAQLAKYIAAKRQAQVSRLQIQARMTAIERRKLITMLVELGHASPCDHRPPEQSSEANC